MTVAHEATVASEPRAEPQSGPLPAPPELTGLARHASESGRQAFRILNRWFMGPMLRAGLGAWLATPLGGWVLLLRVRGRKSGLVRETPLNYLVAEGSAWVVAGWAGRADWYRNLLAEPRVDVVLPGRTRACIAQEELDRSVRRQIIPRLIRSTGMVGFLTGIDPFRASDDEMLEVTEWVPLIRLRPEDGPLVAGPDDPGGLGWVWRQAAVLLAGAWLVRALRQLLRG